MTAPGSNKIDIWYHCVDEVPTDLQLSTWLKLLSEEEKARYHRFYFDKDRVHFIVAHALQRLALSQYLPVHPEDWRFEKNAWGKPSVVNLEGKAKITFNLSHTQGLVACGVAFTDALGLDVEWIDRHNSLSDIARHFFSPSELAYFEATPTEGQRDVFFRFWTLKEAYIKAQGQGLSIPLNSFSLQLDQNRAPGIRFTPDHPCIIQEWNFFEYQPRPAYRMALAIRQHEYDAWRVELHPAQQLLQS